MFRGDQNTHMLLVEVRVYHQVEQDLYRLSRSLLCTMSGQSWRISESGVMVPIDVALLMETIFATSSLSVTVRIWKLTINMCPYTSSTSCVRHLVYAAASRKNFGAYTVLTSSVTLSTVLRRP